MEAVEGRDGFSAAMQELWKTGHGSEKAGGEEFPRIYWAESVKDRRKSLEKLNFCLFLEKLCGRMDNCSVKILVLSQWEDQKDQKEVQDNHV